MIFKPKVNRKNSLRVCANRLLQTFGLVLALFLIQSFCATPSMAQNQKVTLHATNEPLSNVLADVSKQTDYKFFYSDNATDPNMKVTINVTDQPLKEALEQLFKGKDISFQLKNKQILLFRKRTISESNASGNTKKINGVVTDEKGEAIIGANVILKSTGKGTISDVDGRFSLETPNRGTLLISYIGYENQEISIGNSNVLNIKLKESSKALDEVVVVGYGVQKKLTVTGSVAAIKGDKLLKAPQANLTNTLQGHLPGLIAPNRSGEPGRDEAPLLIRGRSTTGDTNPLIIIDGVERSEYANTNSTKRSGLGQLDANDIESITVLKDASASIYGARAANGVILVTTKRGATGKPNFNFSFNQGFSQPTRVPDVLDAVLYATVRNEADARNGATTVPYSAADIQKFADGSDPIGHPNTDWVKETLKPWTLQNKMNLSVTGGNDKLKYFMSLSSQDQDGNFKNNPTNYQLYGIRSNVDAFITKSFTISLDISGRYEKKNYPSTDTWTNFVNILSADPTLLAKYPNGLIAAGRLGQNPLLRDQCGSDKVDNIPLTSTLSGKYEVPFIKGLVVSGSYNFDVRHQFEKVFQKPYYYYQYNSTTSAYDRIMSTNITTPSVNDRFDRWIVSTYNAKANYNRTFGKHSVGALLGWEQSRTNFNYTTAYRKNYASDLLPEINLGGSAASDQSTGGNSYSEARNNYFGRLNYNFNEKYLVELLFRYDGSPIFPEGKRFGFFPGASLGWRASEESFIKDNFKFINNLKFRASYGTSGNDRVNAFQYMLTYSLGDNYTFGSNDVSGIVLNTMPNKDITWEVVKTANVGFDLSLWNNLLGITFDYFTQKRSNILITPDQSVPSTFGFPGLPNRNMGKINNHGFEVVASHYNKIGKVGYNVTANMSFARNKVIFTDETPTAYTYQLATGHPLGSQLVYKTIGIFKDQAAIDAYPHLANAKPGDVIILDYNDDKKIDANDQYRENLSTVPEIVFGCDLGLNYKNFDCSLFFQGQANAVLYPGITSLGGSGSNSFTIRAKNRWTVDNPDGTMPRAGGNFPRNSTLNRYSAAFVRLKNLEVGYTLPKSLVNKFGVQNLRAYVNAYNVFTISELNFMDPEADPVKSDMNNYPQLRTFNIGVNVTF